MHNLRYRSVSHATNLSYPIHRFAHFARRFLPSLATRLHEVVCCSTSRIHANEHLQSIGDSTVSTRVAATAASSSNSACEVLPPRAPYFNSDYREHTILADGSVATLRLVRPTDHDLWVEGFSRLSPDSRYFRFGTAKNGLKEKEIRYFTVIDQEAHFAIVAVRNETDGREIGLGVGRFVRSSEDATHAEPAITVIDDAQGHGLGYLLALRLVAAARERGIKYFDANILGSNGRVIRMMKDIAPDSVLHSHGTEIVLSAKLPKVDPRETWAHLHEKGGGATRTQEQAV